MNASPKPQCLNRQTLIYRSGTKGEHTLRRLAFLDRSLAARLASALAPAPLRNFWHRHRHHATGNVDPHNERKGRLGRYPCCCGKSTREKVSTTMYTVYIQGIHSMYCIYAEYVHKVSVTDQTRSLPSWRRGFPYHGHGVLRRGAVVPRRNHLHETVDLCDTGAHRGARSGTEQREMDSNASGRRGLLIAPYCSLLLPIAPHRRRSTREL